MPTRELLPLALIGALVCAGPAVAEQFNRNASASAATTAGSTIAPTLANRATDSVNVKDSGAKGDGTFCSDGVIKANSSALHSASCTFTSADVSKYIVIHGSGASGVAQVGTITRLIDAHNITVSFTSTLAAPLTSTYSATVVTHGTGMASYAPGDTLTVLGGTGIAATFGVTTTQLNSATIVNPGNGGANGTCALTITGGTGTVNATVNATVSGGRLAALGPVEQAAAYTLNPDTAANPVTTSCGLTGATLALSMGARTVTEITAGSWSVAPINPVATTNSGSGGGATLAIDAYATGRFSYGSDDSSAVTAAIAAASAGGRCLYVPAGEYFLASQTTSIPLNNLCIRGDGTGANAWPFTSGSMIWILNQATAAFSGMSGVTIDGIAFYYPAQDSSGESPVIYPALFESVTFLNDSFSNWRVLNAYDMFHVTSAGTGSGWGRVFFDRTLAYCINRCFYFQNGGADTLQIGPTSYFGPGAYGNEPASGPASLSRWTNNNGEFLRLDVGAGAYPRFEGLIFTGFIVQATHTFVREMTGILNVSNWANLNLDAVGTALSVEGASGVQSFSWAGGEIYSTNVYNESQAANVIDISSTSRNVELHLTGIKLAYAQGSFLVDHGMGISQLEMFGNAIHNFGRSTTRGSYYGVATVSNSFGRVNVVGNAFLCNQSAPNTVHGVFLVNSSGNVTGNTFANCQQAITFAGNTAQGLADGNVAYGTFGSRSLANSATIPAHVTVGSNSFDKP